MPEGSFAGIENAYTPVRPDPEFSCPVLQYRPYLVVYQSIVNCKRGKSLPLKNRQSVFIGSGQYITLNVFIYAPDLQILEPVEGVEGLQYPILYSCDPSSPGTNPYCTPGVFTDGADKIISITENA